MINQKMADAVDDVALCKNSPDSEETGFVYNEDVVAQAVVNAAYTSFDKEDESTWVPFDDVLYVLINDAGLVKNYNGSDMAVWIHHGVTRYAKLSTLLYAEKE